MGEKKAQEDKSSKSWATVSRTGHFFEMEKTKHATGLGVGMRTLGSDLLSLRRGMCCRHLDRTWSSYIKLLLVTFTWMSLDIQVFELLSS